MTVNPRPSRAGAVLCCLVSMAAGCDLAPLTEDSLYRPSPDAAVQAPAPPPPDASLDTAVHLPPDAPVVVDTAPDRRQPDAGCASIVCPGGQSCDPATLTCRRLTGPGSIRGVVSGICRSGVGLAARLSVLDQRQCATPDGKGGFSFFDLPLDIPLQLVAYRPGYATARATFTLTAAAPHQTVDVNLVPEPSHRCDGNPPPVPACECPFDTCSAP